MKEPFVRVCAELGDANADGRADVVVALKVGPFEAKSPVITVDFLDAVRALINVFDQVKMLGDRLMGGK